MKNTKYLTLKEASEYLGLSTSTLYKMNMARVIPFTCPGGKNIYYDVADLDKYIEQNRQASAEELQTQAADYVLNH